MKLNRRKPWMPHQTKTFKRFAFFPVWLGEYGLNGKSNWKLTECIWLEFYYEDVYRQSGFVFEYNDTILKRYQ